MSKFNDFCVEKLARYEFLNIQPVCHKNNLRVLKSKTLLWVTKGIRILEGSFINYGTLMVYKNDNFMLKSKIKKLKELI